MDMRYVTGGRAHKKITLVKEVNYPPSAESSREFSKDGKRKREEASPEEFKRSKITRNSPARKHGSNNMEKMMKMMSKLMEQNNSMPEEIKMVRKEQN
ncbi:hypothetical protein ILUMI_13384 [Ignelater luminosus]|uniref:Uncharacterized protein n=1 Tax=Ignelater luminosus TaxID=2038154 RepID=A0A8K0CUL3_IGNLU|nr:hypothetical protein ILUMI_13384 [Ignelater luminosus]